MNTNLVKIAFIMLLLMSVSCCTTSTSDDILVAYLFHVKDSYPQPDGGNNLDSVLNSRCIWFYYQLKNETKQTYWLKLEDYGGDEKDSIYLVGYSVHCNNKSIRLEPTYQQHSFIYPPKGSTVNHRETLLNPGDSACITIRLPEYILDSLGITKITPTIDITRMIGVDSHQHVDNYAGYKIPHITLLNSNNLGEVKDFEKRETAVMPYNTYIDSVNKIRYTFPINWATPLINYRIRDLTVEQ